MKGILFKSEMSLAIREGRKTVTRRQDGLKEINLNPDDWEVNPSTQKVVLYSQRLLMTGRDYN